MYDSYHKLVEQDYYKILVSQIFVGQIYHL